MTGGIGERLAYIDQVIGAALAEVFQPQKPWPHDSRPQRCAAGTMVHVSEANRNGRMQMRRKKKRRMALQTTSCVGSPCCCSLKLECVCVRACVQAEASKGTGIAVDIPQSERMEGTFSVDMQLLPVRFTSPIAGLRSNSNSNSSHCFMCACVRACVCVRLRVLACVRVGCARERR